MRGDEQLRKTLQSHVNRGALLAITPITLCELYKGAFMSTRPVEALELISIFLEGVEVLDLFDVACMEFGKQHSTLMKKGKPTQQFDLLIGVIAKMHDHILVTRNRKDFEYIEGLKIEQW